MMREREIDNAIGNDQIRLKPDDELKFTITKLDILMTIPNSNSTFLRENLSLFDCGKNFNTLFKIAQSFRCHIRPLLKLAWFSSNAYKLKFNFIVFN